MHLVRHNIRNFIKHVWLPTQPDMGGCDTAPQIFWGKLWLFAVGRDLQKPCTNGQIWVWWTIPYILGAQLQNMFDGSSLHVRGSTTKHIWWTIPYIWGAQLQNPVRVVSGRVKKNRCQGTNNVLGTFVSPIQNKKYFEGLWVNIS